MSRLSQISCRAAAASVLMLTGLVLPGSSVAAHAACYVPERVSDRPVTGVLSAEEAAAAQRDFETRTAAEPKARQRAAQDVTLDLYWHVVSKDGSLGGGNVPDSRISQQMEVLNNDYASTGVRFRLAGVDRTVKPAWADAVVGSSAAQMKRALRRGGAADLNVYSVPTLKNAQGDELRGFGTYPWNYADAPKIDGVIVRSTTMPGGTQPFDLGKTLTHETGHWVGLYNTFQGGCTSPGDYVDDTPYEASPAAGCPNGRDTCPAPGVDPIHNFMDGSDDSCMDNFTPGQATRLREQIHTYRGVPR